MTIPTSEELINTQYFIDPDGIVHKYKGNRDATEIISLHHEIADMLFGHLKINDCVTYMMDLGWILVGSSCYSCPIIHKYPSQAQINTLYDLNLYHRLTFLHNDHYPNFVENETTARIYL